MCNFFSFCTTPKGEKLYFDWDIRKKCLSGEFDYDPDSHTSIANYFGYKGNKEDRLNKYEYNPITGEFVVDLINHKDDSKRAEAWVRKLDFKDVVKPLIVKPILNPLLDRYPKTVTKRDKKLLEELISIHSNFQNKAQISVGRRVGNRVWDSVRDVVWDIVWYRVRDVVWDIVWYRVLDSVVSITAAYISSFFDIKYSVDLSSGIKLWERGYVPSFDGETWRLHRGKEAEIVYELKL